MNVFNYSESVIIFVIQVHLVLLLEYRMHNADPITACSNMIFPKIYMNMNVVVIDLQNKRTVDYVASAHQLDTKGNQQHYFLSNYPANLFDPRAASAWILKNELRPLVEKDSILIVFADKQEEISYELVQVTATGPYYNEPEMLTKYDFYDGLQINRNITGKDTKVVLQDVPDFTRFLNHYNNTAKYTITFDSPKNMGGDSQENDKNFIPLMVSGNDEIISFAQSRGKNAAFFFPHIKEKAQFLVDFFDKILAARFPAIFSVQSVWIESPAYRLPNENGLLQEKQHLQEEHAKNMKEVESRIETNRQMYGFLHELLTQSGDLLVKAIVKYFKWLGFENVVNVDETNPNLREEDIRIETKEGVIDY